MDLPAVEIGISTSAYENFPLDAALERISHLSNRAEVLSEAFDTMKTRLADAFKKEKAIERATIL